MLSMRKLIVLVSVVNAIDKYFLKFLGKSALVS